MASIRCRDGKLLFDFRFGGQRCREQTTLDDTPANRKLMAKMLEKIDAEITLGTFEYARYFPNSKRAAELTVTNGAVLLSGTDRALAQTPLFVNFAETWKKDKSAEWRRSYLDAVES